MVPAHLAFLCLALLWPARLSFAREVNVTIDDTLGDERTGERPRYTPSDWRPRSVSGAPCQRCTANPDPTLVISGTWHDKSTFVGQDASTVSMTFSGTAVYVFCIIANGLGRTTNITRLSFFVDDLSTPVGSFLHELDTTQPAPYYLYNHEVFRAVSLPPGNHTLLVANEPGDTGSLILFDYAMYTTDEPDSPDAERTPESTPSASTSTTPGVPSSSMTPASAARNTKAVIGGAVGGGLAGALALLAIFGYYVYSRRRKAARARTEGFVRAFEPRPSLPQGSSTSEAGTGHVSSDWSPWSLVASRPATQGGRESLGLRYEIGRMREELARVRRLAEPPEYTGPAVAPSQGRSASSSARASRVKVMAADHVQAA